MQNLAKWPLIALVSIFVPWTGYAQTVRISYGGTSGYNVPLWVTDDAGLFKKHGLTAELILISGAAASMQAMLANETQFANTSGSAPVNVTLQGVDAVIIATSYDAIPYGIVVHKDIRSPADLKGKRIAISRFGGVTELAVKIALEKWGLSPKDITMIQAGADAQRIPAVQTGAVAASVLAPPALFQAQALGLRTIADISEMEGKYPTSTMFVMRSYLAQNRATVKKFLRAFIEGLHLYAEKKDFSMAVMQKYTKLQDQEVLSKSHNYFVKKTLLVPLTDSAAVKNALPEKARDRRPEEFYDDSLIKELLNEGFVDKIAKKAR